MSRNALASLLCVFLATAWAGCTESAAPALSRLSQAGRSVAMPNDSVWTTTDSVPLGFAGFGAGGARWTAASSAPWVSLAAAQGTGGGFLRWTRDPTDLGYGTFVDTITVTSGGAAAQILDSVVIGGPPATFVTARRPWRPGERDSVAAAVVRTRAWGEFSDVAPQLLAGSDSATEVVPNLPLAGAGPSRAARVIALGQKGQTWMIVGLQIREVFPVSPGSSTLDSLRWLGVFWYASPESTWIGRMVFATSAATYGRTTVNTAAFDSSGGKSGLGGGEARASTGQYWEANIGKFQVNSNVCSPASCANATFTSGPWKGGLWHGLLIGGQMINIRAPCKLPAGCTSVDTFNINFRGSPVPGVYINCVFPTPCTGAAAEHLAALARRSGADGGADPAWPPRARLTRRR